MNKILIITTYGCEACEIAKRNVEVATLQTGKTIEVESKDWRDCKREFIINNKIKDYPVVIYFIDDNVVHKAIGTYPSPVYLRWIDMYFKI